MVSMSTHNTAGIFTKNVLIPGEYLFENLGKILRSNMFRFYGNSLKIAIISTAVSIFISSTAGYALGKLDFKGKKFIMRSILMVMMVPAYLGLIGYIKEMGMLGMTKTHIPLILIWFANPFGVYWMTNFIEDKVPDEVLESARIDGSNEFRTFWIIVIPYIKPALITIALLIFLGSWNLYLMPLILINKVELYTVPLAINLLDPDINVADIGARITSLTLSTLPILIMFAFGTKYFIKGLTAGAVKG